MGKVTLSVQTLTPLWTGGVDWRKKAIHETGIIGSLRWWYEALVRTAGGRVHPDDDKPCSYDQEKYDKATGESHQRLHAAGLCDACQLFGATGWQRRFKLLVDDSGLVPDRHVDPDPANKGKMHVDVDGSDKGWYINQGLRGTASFTFLGEEAGLAADLLYFVAKHAGIGAQTQLGHGVVRIREPHSENDFLLDHLRSLSGGGTQDEFADLRRMFFARVALAPAERRLETPFEIKVALRSAFHQSPQDQVMRHDVLGKVYIRNRPVGREDRYGSMVSISRPYDSQDGPELRLWGWAPRKYWPETAQRIKAALEHGWNLRQWTQFDSPLDPAHQGLTDPLDYLVALGR